MQFNTLGFSTPRALAFATLASVATLGVASGVFGTFSTSIIPGQTCTGYGYFSGYGYGYDCTPVVVVSSGGGGGGGGGGGTVGVTVTPTVTPTATPVLVPVVAPPTPTVVEVKDIIARDIIRSPFRAPIQKLISLGVMQNQKNVRPNDRITRAEFLKLLALANGYTPVTVKKKFADLPSTHSLYAYVNFGVSQGWVNVRNTNFRPDDIVTQGEIDKLIAAIKGTANADTVALKTPSVSRGKAASDIVEAFY